MCYNRNSIGNKFWHYKYKTCVVWINISAMDGAVFVSLAEYIGHGRRCIRLSGWIYRPWTALYSSLWLNISAMDGAVFVSLAEYIGHGRRCIRLSGWIYRPWTALYSSLWLNISAMDGAVFVSDKTWNLFGIYLKWYINYLILFKYSQSIIQNKYTY